MYDPILPEDVKIKEHKKIYQKLFNYFHVFKQSHSPFTINWLLEILNIFSLKYGVKKEVFDQRLKKEYTDLIVQLFTNCSLIMTDQFNIEFKPDQKYAFALPPTVYEFLFRYEYIQTKHTVNSNTIQNFAQPQPKKSLAFDTIKSKSNGVLDEVDSGQNSIQQELSEDQKLRQRMEERMQSNKIDKNLVYFTHETIKQLKESNFEYQHKKINAQVGYSIFKDMDLLMSRSSDSNLNQMYLAQTNFMSKIRLALRNIHYQKNILVHSKFYAILTLKQVLFQFLIHLTPFEEEEKKLKILSIIMKCVVDLLLKQQQTSSNDTQKADKVNKMKQKPADSEVINEQLLEFFAFMIEKCNCIDQEKKLLIPYRKFVNEIFNYDNFFSTTMYNFQQWKRIIRNIQTDESLDEALGGQLGRWRQQQGFFFENNAQSFTTQRCLALKRFSFLVFVCDFAYEDEEQQNLNIFKKLNQTILEGLNKQHQPNDLNQIKERIFIFFITRVALSRQNTKQLIESLKTLWPHLLSELVSIFEQSQNEQNVDQIYCTNSLRIEAIKLIEMLASLNLEDFQMNQWIFLVDKIGMAPDVKQPQSAKRQTEKLVTNEGQGETFKTFIVKYIGPEMQYTFNKYEEPSDGLDEGIYDNFWVKREQQMDQQFDESMVSQQNEHSKNNWKQKKLLIDPVDESRIKDDSFTNAIQVSIKDIDKDKRTKDLVTKHARELQRSINDQHAQGSLVDRQDALKKIEQDFIDNSEILNH